MSKSKFAAALLCVAAVYFVGCSGAGDTTAPGPSAEEQYAEFSADISDFVESIVDFVGQGYDEFQEFDPTAMPPPPQLGKAVAVLDSVLQLDTTYTNGWYVITATEQSATEIVAIADSIKFVDATGSALQYPTEQTTNGIYLKEHAEVTVIMTEFGLTMGFTVHGDFSFLGFQTTAVTVDGSADFGMDLTGATEYGPTTIEMTYDVDINNVTVANPEQGGSGCTTGGTFAIDFTGKINGYDENGKRINETVAAAITVTFNAGGSGYYTVDIDGQRFTETISGCSMN